MLVLSLFPGIGLLDMAFEQEGFCVVRGPDLLWGGDIRNFNPPAGKFDGVIGGPPCQMFSNLARLNLLQGRQPRFGNLVPEFERCVSEAQPGWFLMENVSAAPLPVVAGYIVRAFKLNNRWLGETQSRERRFSFGSREGLSLLPFIEVVALENPIWESTVVGGNGGTPSQRDRGFKGRTPIGDAIRKQGLPSDFLKDAPFTSDAKRTAIANGVPLPMGRAIARAVKEALASN